MRNRTTWRKYTFYSENMEICELTWVHECAHRSTNTGTIDTHVSIIYFIISERIRLQENWNWNWIFFVFSSSAFASIVDSGQKPIIYFFVFFFFSFFNLKVGFLAKDKYLELKSKNGKWICENVAYQVWNDALGFGVGQSNYGQWPCRE